MQPLYRVREISSLCRRGRITVEFAAETEEVRGAMETGAGKQRFWRDAHELGFSSVFAMDFEGGDRTGVLEYGIVEVTASGLVSFSGGFCAPSGAIPARESQTHGLTTRDVRDAQPFANFWELFRDLRRRGPFLAHSAHVEDRFLRRQWRTPGEVRDWSGVGSSSIEWGPWLDSCGVFRSIRPGEAAALEKLVESEGLQETLDRVGARECDEGRCRWHAALYDTIASALLFRRAIEVCPDWGARRFFRESQGRSPSEQGILGFD